MSNSLHKFVLKVVRAHHGRIQQETRLQVRARFENQFEGERAYYRLAQRRGVDATFTDGMLHVYF